MKSAIRYHLRCLVRYASTFGLRYGLALYRSLVLSRNSLISVHVPHTSHPLFLRAKTTDAAVFDQIFLYGDYHLGLDVDPRLILDLGAYTGISSVYFALRFPNATILAVEPDAENYTLLVQNTAPYPRIIPIHAAVWSDDCTRLEIADPAAPKWGIAVKPADGEGIPVTTVPELLCRSGLDRIDLLKMDIEGAEIPIFSSPVCHEWLSRTDIIMIELHDKWYPGASTAFYRALSGYEFRQYLSGETVVIDKSARSRPWTERDPWTERTLSA